MSVKDTAFFSLVVSHVDVYRAMEENDRGVYIREDVVSMIAYAMSAKRLAAVMVCYLLNPNCAGSP